MQHVTWTARPRLRQPVLVAAFEGWNDAGEAASLAARFLAGQWEARPFAEIDPEEFFDFTSTRPRVRLEGGRRRIDWPATELAACTVPGARVDVVILTGHEPQLRWRTYCETVIGVARDLGVRMVVTLGALLADIAHTNPVTVVGTAEDPELMARLDLRASSYQGPTGIVGVLQHACRTAGIPAASLWGAVPTYVPNAPSPKAALALVERTAALLEVPVHTVDLEIAAASYERQLDELVAADEDTAAYVARLAAGLDDDDEEDEDREAGPVEAPDPEQLIAEVERYLRDQD